jgi:ferric-dicitrate binding protein FerR (iron transport regulator)
MARLTPPHPQARPTPARPAAQAPLLARRWAWLAYGAMAVMVLVCIGPWQVGTADVWTQHRPV